MAYNFPVADFSGLADIPKIYDEAQKERLRKTLFEDLKSVKSPQDFRDLGARALRAGLGPEAFQLFGEGVRQQQADQSGLLNQLMIKYLTGQRGGEAGDVPAVTPPPPSTPPMQAPAQAPKLAPVPYTQNAPSTQQAGLSPTEQLLARAEGAAPPMAPPVQLAGPPPTPDTIPPSLNAPPPSQLTPTVSPRGGTQLQMLPPGMPGAQPPPVSPGQLPPAPAGVPPMGATTPGEAPAPLPGAEYNQPRQAAALQEARRLYGILTDTKRFPPPPKGMPQSPTWNALHEAYQRALAVANEPDLPEKTFQQELAIQGPDFTRYGFKAQEETIGARTGGIIKALEDYKKKGEQGDQLGAVVKQLSDIYKNP